MEIRRAERRDQEKVKMIVDCTIESVYPHYYPQGAVELFLAYHNLEHIAGSIDQKRVYLLLTEERKAVGTVTIDDNEINRLFVLPEEQGKGYGTVLMQFAEQQIFEKYDTVTLSASLPAKDLYIKYGYKETGYYKIAADYGDYLCYDQMEKKREDNE